MSIPNIPADWLLVSFCSNPWYSETRLFQNYVKKQFIISLVISSSFFVSQFEIHLIFIVYDVSRITREKNKTKTKTFLHNYTHT